MSDHFYTTIQTESYSAANNGYQFEGTMGQVYQTQASPKLHLFHRLYNGHNHFYTADDLEAENAVGNLGFHYETMPCYVYPVGVQHDDPNAIPLYRAYKKSINDHFYTIDRAELNNAIASDGYSPEGNSEGVCCYVLANAANGKLAPFLRLWHP
jgi:Repeat of unknown function (DUF5648)